MSGKILLKEPHSRRLLQQIGIDADPFREVNTFIEATKQADPRYKGERHLLRYELEEDQTTWSEEITESIMRCAKMMRMLEVETPLEGYPELVIILGGARQSNLVRTEYAIEALNSKKANFSRLVVAGSNRKLGDSEKENVSNYAPGAEDEFDLCAAAAKMAARSVPKLITSQMLIDDEKAGTPDVIKAVLFKSDQPKSVTVVTTQIYQLSTELDLRQIARYVGIKKLAVAGTPSDPEVIAKRTTATYLSEVLRTLRAAADEAAEPRGWNCIPV